MRVGPEHDASSNSELNEAGSVTSHAPIETQIIETREAARSPIEDAVPIKDAVPIEDAVARLGRLKPGLEMDKIVAGLVNQGGQSVVEIERQSTPLAANFRWVHTSVRVLERINNEKSRELLKRIASGGIEVSVPSP